MMGKVFIQIPCWTNGETKATNGETGPTPSHTDRPAMARGKLETRPVPSEFYFVRHTSQGPPSTLFDQHKHFLKVFYIHYS